jgi:hypothetical protein
MKHGIFWSRLGSFDAPLGLRDGPKNNSIGYGEGILDALHLPRPSTTVLKNPEVQMQGNAREGRRSIPTPTEQ